MVRRERLRPMPLFAANHVHRHCRVFHANIRAHRDIGWDYAFVSDSIVPALLHCGTEATAEAWRRSDHCPIVIDLDERAIWQEQYRTTGHR